MVFDDMRAFLDELEVQGELQRISQEVDWDMEAGAIARRCNEIGAPAPLMEKIKGYPKGYRMVGSQMAGSTFKGKKMPFRRLCIALGMDTELHPRDLVEEYIKKKSISVKPIQVSDGSCKEEIHIGEKEVDLFEFPAPMIHAGDGGRFLCTWHLNIFEDPDTGWANWGMYRAMIHTENILGGLFIPFQHGPAIYYQKFESRNTPMPFAIAIGPDPVSAFVSCCSIPAGINEVDIAGGFRGEPVKLIKCETNNLLVPAGSEIVIEGEVCPNERWEEGPFGEFTGYRTSERGARPIYRVKAITHRKDPILPFSSIGMPVDEYAAMASLTVSAEITEVLRSEHFPIAGVASHPVGNTFAIIVSTQTPYANFAQILASRIWGAKAGIACHWVIVVNEDVDPWNLEEVYHNVIFKCHPNRGIHKVESFPGMTLDPFLDFREGHFGLGAATIIDATWPTDWEYTPVNSSFKHIYPKTLQDRVLQRWTKDYGYGEEWED